MSGNSAFRFTDARHCVKSRSAPDTDPATDVERALFAFRGIDFHNKVGYDPGSSSSQFASRSDAATPFSSRTKGEDRDRNSSEDDDDDDEDENEDPTMVGGGRRSGIRRGGGGGGGAKQKKAGEDSDSDFDL